MNTLTLQEAASLLKLHPVTLASWASQGRIPGAKLGKRWVFVADDLLGYVRAHYSRRALQGDSSEIHECHSTSARTHRSGGSKSHAKDIVRCRKALGLPTSGKLGNTTTGDVLKCGSNTGSA
ncbi:helix-turn-helix domain-containing protein [Solimonas terrae]|uniref:Helix-turn-helix domain-containing protein n=1 Tax=Solimonas terrae TaxID=1396819 RepID=A0A6M2BRV1_9GAMM|nr:helix-turn-helix domain-containing protein [Solimonas terrae]